MPSCQHHPMKHLHPRRLPQFDLTAMFVVMGAVAVLMWWLAPGVPVREVISPQQRVGESWEVVEVKHQCIPVDSISPRLSGRLVFIEVDRTAVYSAHSRSYYAVPRGAQVFFTESTYQLDLLFLVTVVAAMTALLLGPRWFWSRAARPCADPEAGFQKGGAALVSGSAAPLSNPQTGRNLSPTRRAPSHPT